MRDELAGTASPLCDFIERGIGISSKQVPGCINDLPPALVRRKPPPSVGFGKLSVTHLRDNKASPPQRKARMAFLLSAVYGVRRCTSLVHGVHLPPFVPTRIHNGRMRKLWFQVNDGE